MPRARAAVRAAGCGRFHGPITWTCRCRNSFGHPVRTPPRLGVTSFGRPRPRASELKESIANHANLLLRRTTRACPAATARTPGRVLSGAASTSPKVPSARGRGPRRGAACLGVGDPLAAPSAELSPRDLGAQSGLAAAPPPELQQHERLTFRRCRTTGTTRRNVDATFPASGFIP